MRTTEHNNEGKGRLRAQEWANWHAIAADADLDRRRLRLPPL